MPSLRQLRRFTASAAIIAGLTLAIPQALAQNKVLTFAQPGETGIDNLDPRINVSIFNQYVQIGIFDPLVRSVGSEIQPGAAESWDISNDGRIYTFHLRDAKWSDGKPVVAGDFVHALQRLFTTSGFSQIYDPILNGAAVREGTKPASELGVRAPDDRTLVIELAEPAPYFLGLATSAISIPGRADLLERYGDKYGADLGTFATNGPFLLEAWQHENEIVLKKNPDYWNADAISLDEVHILVLPDTNTQRNLFDKGELDLYGLSSPLTAEEIATNQAEGKLLRYARGGYSGLTFNQFGQGDPQKAKILSNPNFRKAISYVLDRSAYVEKVLSGNGEPATVQTPPGHTVYPGKTWGEVTPNIGKFHPIHPDAEKSREYMQKALQEAGFASVDDLPEFELLTREDPSNPKLFTPYALSVLTQQVGLKVKLKQVTGPAFYDTFLEPALAFDMVVTGWNPDFDDPYTYMGYWVSSSKDMGATFDNPAFDALLDKANAETDPVKRADILVEAEALFSDIGPSVPFVHFKGTVVVQPWVKNLKTSVFGVPVNYVYVDIVK